MARQGALQKCIDRRLFCGIDSLSSRVQPKIVCKPRTTFLFADSVAVAETRSLYREKNQLPVQEQVKFPNAYDDDSSLALHRFH